MRSISPTNKNKKTEAPVQPVITNTFPYALALFGIGVISTITLILSSVSLEQSNNLELGDECLKIKKDSDGQCNIGVDFPYPCDNSLCVGQDLRVYGTIYGPELSQSLCDSCNFSKDACSNVTCPRGPIGPQGIPGNNGSMGAPGQNFEVNGFGVFNNATIMMIQSQNLTGIVLYYYLVTVDERQNFDYPPGLNENTTNDVLGFNGTVWINIGPVAGIVGK